MAPYEDQETEIAALLSGEVDYIYPQFTDTLSASFEKARPKSRPGIEVGSDYEGFYFQSNEGPFADPVFRQAFAMSIDREAVLQQIYAPIYEAAGLETTLLSAARSFRVRSASTRSLKRIRPGGRRGTARGRWLDPERSGHVGEGRAGARDSLDDQRRQPPSGEHPGVPDPAGSRSRLQRRAGQRLGRGGLPAAAASAGLRHGDVHLHGRSGPAVPHDRLHLRPDPHGRARLRGQNSTGWCNGEASAALEEADVTVDENARGVDPPPST